MTRTNRTKDRVQQSNEELRSLIRHIRDFLTQDSADLESIELVASEVLAMQMPTTPDQLQNLTDEIRLKVGELGHVETILLQSSQDIQRAEALLDQAREASVEATAVKDSADTVKQVLEEVQRVQTSTSSLIKEASAHIFATNQLLTSVQSNTSDAEVLLKNATQRLQRLQEDMTMLRNKSENITQSSQQTHQTAVDVKEMAAEMQKEMDGGLKEKFKTVEGLVDQKAGGVARAKKRAASLQQEAKDLLMQASEKLQLLKGLEKSYEENQRSLETKAELLVQLEASVKELLQQIGTKVTIYSTCLS